MLPVYLFGLAILLPGPALPADSTASGQSLHRFAYCARVGTMDTPTRNKARPGSYWRCMDGAVYVCEVGANIPCDSKADRATHNAGADNYCRESRDATTVPAYATGHQTIYEWHCAAGLAVRGRPTAKLDRRGFRTDFWHRISK
jgi:hypothetical protein